MTTYAFRITGNLAGGDIETKEREVSLVLPGLERPVNVYLSEREKQTGNCSLTLWCGGFNSEGEARAAGAPVKTAYMLTGVLLGVGIDVGDDEVVSPAAHRKDGQPDDRLQPDVHGLQVVPEVEGMIFGFVRVMRIEKIPTSPADFQKKVAECYAPDKQLTKKQTLAAHLYGQSHFHASDSARFLTLISAVESLAQQRYSSPTVCTLIDKFVDTTAASVDLEPSEKTSIKDRLGYLKQESIGSACRALVRTHCGEPAVRDFTRHYDIRSNLLHRGEAPAGANLSVELIALDAIVRRIVLAHVAAS
jgi:hypothetical protein